MDIGLDYGEIEAVLQKIMGKQVGFERMVGEIVEDGKMLSYGKILNIGMSFLRTQIKEHGQNIVCLTLLIISAAILSVIAKSFRNRQVSDMGFYMIYLLMFVIMMRSFGICYEVAENVISDLIDFMKALMPAYLMATAVTAYQTSAVVYYEFFLFMIYYLQKLVAWIILPAIRCYVLLTMFGTLGSTDFFTRGRNSLKRLILFLLKAMIGAAAGLQMIQGMITPAVDAYKQSVLSKGISSLGEIGNIAQNVTDLMLGAGVLLKNGIGAAAAVVIIMICLIPVLQVSGYMVFYHLLAAVAEPVSDIKVTNMIGQMGEGIGLLVKVLFTVESLFLLTIAIVCVTTGGVR